MRHHVVITYQLGCQAVKVDDRLLLIDGCASRWRALWEWPGVSALFSSWFIGMHVYVCLCADDIGTLFGIAFWGCSFCVVCREEGVWWGDGRGREGVRGTILSSNLFVYCCLLLLLYYAPVVYYYVPVVVLLSS